MTPQAHTVLNHIRNAGSISQREALMDHSIQCLTKRVQELRVCGYKVKTTFKKHPITGQRYARYHF